MSRKRRMFDIDVPDDVTPEPQPRVSSLDPDRQRRGPMASAIAENSDALTTRASAEAAIRAENDALAHEYVGLKRAGLVTKLIPLDAVVSEALIRDRKPGPDPELDELIASITDVGLSNPIRVEARPDGKYELVQGFRRLSAYRALRDVDADKWATIPANVLPHGEGVAGLYRQMVDENLVRKNLSFAEMASVAQAYASDPDTIPQSVDDAVSELFKSAAYNKRSYIRSFAQLLDLVGDSLAFSQDIPRNLGLEVLKRIKTDRGVLETLRKTLAGLGDHTSETEIDRLRAVIGDNAKSESVPAVDGQGPTPRTRRPRSTFEFTYGDGRVKCTTGVDHLTLKLNKDLTTVERDKLEAGIRGLLDALE